MTLEQRVARLEGEVLVLLAMGAGNLIYIVTHTIK